MCLYAMHPMHQRNVQKDIWKRVSCQQAICWAHWQRKVGGSFVRSRDAREKQKRRVFKRGEPEAANRERGDKACFWFHTKASILLRHFAKKQKILCRDMNYFATRSLPGPNFMLANQSRARKINTFEGNAFCNYWQSNSNTLIGGRMHGREDTCTQHYILWDAHP